MSRDHDVLALILELSYLRACTRVGMALCKQFPDDAAWTHALASDDFQLSAEEFSQVVHDVEQALEDTEVLTPDSVAHAVSKHYDRALSAVQDFAQLTGTEPEDLLRVMVRA